MNKEIHSKKALKKVQKKRTYGICNDQDISFKVKAVKNRLGLKGLIPEAEIVTRLTLLRKQN